MAEIRILIQKPMNGFLTSVVVNTLKRRLDRKKGTDEEVRAETVSLDEARESLEEFRPHVFVSGSPVEESERAKILELKEIAPETTFIEVDLKMGKEELDHLILTTAREVKWRQEKGATGDNLLGRYHPSPKLVAESEWIVLRLQEQLAGLATQPIAAGEDDWLKNIVRARKLLDPDTANTRHDKLRSRRIELGREVFGFSANPSVFGRVCRAFALSPLESEILLLCLAPEINGSFARVIGLLNSNIDRQRPTVSLMAGMMGDEGSSPWNLRQLLAGAGSLGRYHLLTYESGGSWPRSEVGLIPAAELISFMLAGPEGQPDYGALITIARPAPDKEQMPVHDDVIGHWLTARIGNAAPMMQLSEEPGAAGWFEGRISRHGVATVRFDLSRLDKCNIESLKSAAIGAAIVAQLHDAALLVTGRALLSRHEQNGLDASVLPWLSTRVSLLVVQGGGSWVRALRRRVRVLSPDRLGAQERAALWVQRARELDMEFPQDEIRRIASTLRFEEADIDATLRLYEPGSGVAGLHEAGRRIARADAPPSVRRIQSSYGWEDIVLPDELMGQLKSIPCHVVHADKVLDEWGYRKRMPYGHGVTALFTGASGCGKTMAAQIIAGDLGVGLFQVDLSKTVSKYIGETEKNLDEIFDAAEKSNAVLLFDEADALFGKRTEVRDAHDRYANVEIAYLLQRMESYAGLAILTTNFRRNLDKAFTRRLRFILDFPTPGPLDREKIWHLVFPKEAPRASDIDFSFLARRLELTGGNIQQIAIRAAFTAIANGGTIRMKDILTATRHELHKLGRLSDGKMLEGFAA